MRAAAAPLEDRQHQPHPVEAAAAGEFLAGREPTAEVLAEAAQLAARPAKPLDNADLTHFWRKRMVRVVVERAIERALV